MNKFVWITTLFLAIEQANATPELDQEILDAWSRRVEKAMTWLEEHSSMYKLLWLERIEKAVIKDDAQAVEALLWETRDTISAEELKNLVNLWCCGKSLLYLAAKNGNFEITQRLIQKGANVNKMNHLSQETPLHEAVSAKSPALVQLLLEEKANPNVQNRSGHTPLFRVVSDYDKYEDDESHLDEIIKLLLKYGANATIPENGFCGISPKNFLNPIAWWRKEGEERSKALSKKLKELFDQFPDCCKPHQDETLNSLYSAACSADECRIQELIAMLTSGKISFEIMSSLYHGTTLLHVAVKANNIQLVQALLEHGANTMECDDLGHEPRFYACGDEITSLLIKKEYEHFLIALIDRSFYRENEIELTFREIGSERFKE